MTDEEIALLRSGAEAGLADAQAAFGQAMLDAGDAGQALRWFHAAAAQNDAMAINMVGRCHEKGWGTPADRIEATRWYRAAAEHGLDWGMYNYGSALGLGVGEARDEVAALGWFQRAGALGHAKSINFVGTFHEEGRIVRHDMDKAAECYRVAADGGDFRGQFNHARLLAEAGQIDEAVAWIARAGKTASPDFRLRMRAWCKASPVPTLQAAGAAL